MRGKSSGFTTASGVTYMHVTYQRCKSYRESKDTRVVSTLFFRTGLLKIIGSSLPALSITGTNPAKATAIAEDLLEVAGRLPDLVPARGLKGWEEGWFEFLLGVDFVHGTYIRSGNLKPDLL